jgi:mono/diheme cytochrome c family protein
MPKRGDMKQPLAGTVIMFAIVGAVGSFWRPSLMSAQQAKGLPDATYGAAQAERGGPLYAANCVACHGTDLLGGDRAPALAGPAFTARWSNRPLSELLDYMQVQMPLQSPGGLTRHQNADILAFVLRRNGIPVGQKDLADDGPDSASPLVQRRPGYGQVAKPSTKRAEAFYSEEQAKRGKLAFNRNCAFCHTVDPKLSTPEDLVQALPRTFGGHFIERVVDGKVVYPTVLALYSKLLSMPAFNTKAITEQQRVDIAAYILQANGLPSGTSEIPVNPDSMRLMMVNEPGFERLFNGWDFGGWNFVLGPNCAPAPNGCGKTEPGDVVRVEHETIICECNVHGYFYTDRKYKAFTLRFDTKFERPWELGDSDDEELFSGGGGYLIFSDIGAAGYPKSIEVEGRHRDLLDFYAIGGPGKIGQVDVEARRRAMRPLGQWNAIEILARNGQVHTSLNGVPISSITKHDYNHAGHIAFQVQGRKMYWRNIRINVE